LRASERLLDAARHREPPAQLLEETGTRLQAYAADLLGVRDEVGSRRAATRPIDPGTARPRTLRERGEALTRLAYDTRYEEPQHPAAARILSELAPDEALILMALRDQGPQPAVDVRVATNLYTSSRLVTDTLTMIGSVAGVHYVERVPAYLINLERLGLTRNLREPISDPSRYMILEAQPDVLEALKSSRGTRTVRRSILLTPFGEEFCRLALPEWAGPGDPHRVRPSDHGA
ncbi:MAG: Abi-alpha family protein, partial [Solirubrobacteraceae bacterium]